jgi:hypothetical protein
MQQNFGNSTIFAADWVDYKRGFGDPSGNYWLGNDRIHQITSTGLYKMRADVLVSVTSYKIVLVTWPTSHHKRRVKSLSAM